ncbi:hypothetical protein [Bdellovibrio sp. NC01]|uniref:c-type cytochrome n=1 Tax=Bdellovibrio sp. NC01 TaxID=2220073 RepID=UPI001156D364|nr:hypothetical protein [Bdellovibrio sp. NC01]QDK38582.1 hypothetical protein DOE51_13835 [Bdellovibrio sp. NC01]
MKTWIALSLTLLSSLSLAATKTYSDKEFADASRDFLFSDFGSINQHSLASNSNSIPKQVAMTALVMEGRRKGWIGEYSQDYKAVLARFGFYTPSVVLNAPVSMKADFKSLPMGMTEREIEMGLGIRITAVNITCAVCHAGHLYDEKGQATSQAWMGLPNTSINMEGYSQALYQGMRIISNNMSGTFRLMTNMFPEMTFKERTVYKLAVFPRVKKAVRNMEDLYKQAVPFSNGGPGLTNGVAALKMQLGMLDMSKVQPEFGFTSIPSLGDRYLRTSLLWDGVYASPKMDRNHEKSSWNDEDENFINAVAALFTIPTMGQSTDGALANIPRVQKALSVVFNKYEAPAYPGEIDIEKATRGSVVFENNCTKCHGTYEWQGQRPKLVSYPNRMVSQENMGTDPLRWQAVTDKFAEQFNKSSLAKAAIIVKANGYIAPILNSLWATAPYLHNGSVPTLWHMLHPEQRPTKFMVGGHNLDLEKVGVKLVLNETTGVWEYPSDVKPFSQPVVYDTTKPGLSNAGHTRPFAKLSEDEKSDLLEYLKLL